MRCAVGDLAIIIFSAHQENIGGMVAVVSRSADPDMGDWIVRTLQPLKGSDHVLGQYVTVPAGELGGMLDCNLYPIRGQRSASADPVHQIIEEHAGI